MNRKASIDIGTNSTRLLVADLDENKTVFPLVSEVRITRLGEDIGVSQRLSGEAIARVVGALKEYLAICQRFQTQSIIIFATSATREASNMEEFLQQIKKGTGRHCRVFSGEEEARLSFQGVLSDLKDERTVLICDIGGGSTEFIVGSHETINWKKSLDIGSRRLSRLFATDDPYEVQILIQIKEYIRNIFKKEIDQLVPVPERCVCVGGTATTLAMIDQKLDLVHASQVDHSELKLPRLRQLINDLANKSVHERKMITGLHPERADVIVTGALIMEAIMDYLGFSSSLISIRDLLYGILLEEER